MPRLGSTSQAFVPGKPILPVPEQSMTRLLAWLNDALETFDRILLVAFRNGFEIRILRLRQDAAK